MAIGLYDRTDAGELVLRDRVELDVTGDRTEVTDLHGRPRPDVVLLNDDDLTYAKIRLDPQSLSVVTESIAGFQSTLARSLCWSAAWDMTRDGEMSATDYVTLVLHGIASENDSSVVRTCCGRPRRRWSCSPRPSDGARPGCGSPTVSSG